VDINYKPRDLLETAVRSAGGPGAPVGKVIANLTFGFWRYLSSKGHEKTLWVPYLHTAFASGTSRAGVDARIGRLHTVRNRVAHHESLLNCPLRDHLADLLWVAERIDPTLAQYIWATTEVPAADAARP
jgi:hypothetical protein